MGWFEENPLFLVGFIVVTVEAWNWVKRRALAVMRNRSGGRA
jgi:hypothetical protein